MTSSTEAIQTDTPAENADRWTAVVTRDSNADGRFYYAVTTTGVYCRPSCGARAPRAENLRYYATAEAAEAAGFRPCRRCRPDQSEAHASPPVKPYAPHSAKIAAACKRIESATDTLSLGELAQQAGMSPYYFHRVFKATTGLTPKAYARAQRATLVRSALRGQGRITDAIYEAGFGSAGRFYENADAILGMPPKSYRKGGKGMMIRFAVGDCFLGSILVAQSERGICAILLGEDPDRLTQDLQDRFPNARLIGGDVAFEQVVAQVVGFVQAPGLGLDLPLDIQGTAFQQRVWQALREIPPGSTASYADIAERIGSPTAVRAVAGACAANKIAVAIPCHRVVRMGGGLSGYRWGVERKRALLDREAGDLT